jgi:hypothetical protein
MSLILDGSNGLSDVDGTAATPAIRGTDTNTGIFFPAADTIAFSEGGVEQMRLNSDGDLQMNSGYGSVATAYGCRAWVNFNGTGTVAIRASGNVSSITDITTGVYAINFTTAMPNINYAVTSTAATYGLVSIDTISTTSFRFVTANATATALVDLVENHVAIFR